MLGCRRLCSSVTSVCVALPQSGHRRKGHGEEVRSADMRQLGQLLNSEGVIDVADEEPGRCC